MSGSCSSTTNGLPTGPRRDVRQFSITPLTPRWLSRLSLAALWLLITAGVAFGVARYVETTTASDADALMAPPITGAERSTAVVEAQTIQPTLSGDGVVMADGDNFILEAPVTPVAQAYQLLDDPISVRALIVGGPVGFDCAWLGLGQAPEGGVTMRCQIPEDIRVVPGLSGTMVLALTEPVEVLALPITAVAGGAQQGEVIVVHEDGRREPRPVELGIADAFWIEITAGLNPGDTVLAAPVQTDFVVNES